MSAQLNILKFAARAFNKSFYLISSRKTPAIHNPYTNLTCL